MVDAVVKFALAAAQSPEGITVSLMLVFAGLMLVGYLVYRLTRSVRYHSNRLHGDVQDFKKLFQVGETAQTTLLTQIRDLLGKESASRAGQPIILSLDGVPAQVGRMGQALDKLDERLERMDERLERMERSELARGGRPARAAD